MKKLVLFMMCMSFMFGVELNFKDVTLDEFKLYGMNTKIVYKNKKQRDEKIAKIWEKFLGSKSFLKVEDIEKIFVVYSDYKKDSFDCYIGVKSSKAIGDFKLRTVSKSKYNKTILDYNPSVKINDVWDQINEKKLKRDFKIDMEEYNMEDLVKSSYKINIYLSKK